jgi:heterodisulfide reductase subunit B
MAIAEQEMPGQDMVTGCPACWLALRDAKGRFDEHASMKTDANEALKEVSLTYQGNVKPRHMTEVLIEDIGYEGMKAQVVRPLEGVKIAGYVGCQTNRPFGIAGESFENPKYLDKMIETVGAEAVPYDQKVTCCGGALAFSEPDKAYKQIRDIVESAYDHGAQVIATPCQLCQANVELYQSEINKKQGTKFNMPVVFYSQLLSLSYGGNLQQTGLDGQVIRAEVLEKLIK